MELNLTASRQVTDTHQIRLIRFITYRYIPVMPTNQTIAIPIIYWPGLFGLAKRGAEGLVV
jgi:hypothetical protein